MRVYVYATFLILYFVEIRLMVLFQNNPNTRVTSIKNNEFYPDAIYDEYEEIINITSIPKNQT